MASRSRPSSARPTAAKRASLDSSRGRRRDASGDRMYEYKAAYLVLFDDISEEITSEQQLAQALQMAGRTPTKKTVSKYWTLYKGYVTFDNFCDICDKEAATSEEDLMKAFHKIDLNGDGYLTNSELRRVLTTRGEKMTVQEVQAIIDEVDENKDGRLDFKEFCKMLLNTQEETKHLAIQKMERKGKRKPGAAAPPRVELKPENRQPDKLGSQASLNTHASSELEEESEKKRGSEETAATENGDNDHKSTETNEKDKKTEQENGETAVQTADSGSKSTADEENNKSNQSDDNTAPEKERRPMGPQSTDRGDDSEKKGTSPHATPSTVEENANHHAATEKKSEEESEDDIVIGSRVSLHSTSSSKYTKGSSSPPKPRPRRTIEKADSQGGGSRTSPRPKERSKSPLAGKDLKLPKPKKLRDWKLSHSKGCFFFDDDGSIVSHQYTLRLPRDTSIWITIEPYSLRPGADLNSAREVSHAPIDTMLFILRDDNSLVSFADHRDIKGKYGMRCDLEKGKYKLLPFTTGARFKRRTSEPSLETKLVKKKDNKHLLTKPFKDALSDIFDLCDLDGNGQLSRDEFNWFNLRTSGEEVNDEEWDVVRGNVEMKNDEIMRQGFITLNQMEANDSEGDTEDLWVTLTSMGYNKGLQLDEACPFLMEVYTETCEAALKVIGVEPPGSGLNNAMVEATVGKGEASKVKYMKDLIMHTFMNDFRACVVFENMSHSRVSVGVDCSKSRNCSTNREDLEHTVNLPAKGAVIAHHLMPLKETQPWTLHCRETVIK